jgi:hypothetical protein
MRFHRNRTIYLAALVVIVIVQSNVQDGSWLDQHPLASFGVSLVVGGGTIALALFLTYDEQRHLAEFVGSPPPPPAVEPSEAMAIRIGEAHDAIRAAYGPVNWGTPVARMCDVWHRALRDGVIDVEQLALAQADSGDLWRMPNAMGRTTG